jgi:hypothetical protein
MEVTMSGTQLASSSRRSLADSAVDGLLAGAGAGLVMGVVLVLLGQIAGESWQQVLAGLDPRPATSTALGAVAHVAVAGIYGALFAVMTRWVEHRAAPYWIAAVGYGLLLFFVAEYALQPGLHVTLPAVAAPLLALAHVVYGVTLAWMLARVHES